MLANTILIPIMGVAIKTLAAEGVSTLEMLVWRSLIVIAVLLPFLALAEHRRAIGKADLKAHAIHALFTVSSMACFYYALRTLPIVTVTAINFTTPVFALILARILFAERVSRAGWAAMGLGFLGTLTALRPDASGIGLDAVVVLLGSVLAAGTVLSVRRMPARSSNFATIFFLSLFGAILYGALGASSVGAPTTAQLPWVGLLAAIALAVHTCLIFAYRFASSMLVGALDYLRVVWAVVIGFLFLAEVPDLVDGFGIALIVVSGALVLRESARRVPPPAA